MIREFEDGGGLRRATSRRSPSPCTEGLARSLICAPETEGCNINLFQVADDGAMTLVFQTASRFDDLDGLREEMCVWAEDE
jgi:hypothetical protein